MQCDACEQWYHPACVGLSVAEVDAMQDEGYRCIACAARADTLLERLPPSKHELLPPSDHGEPGPARGVLFARAWRFPPRVFSLRCVCVGAAGA